LRKLGCANYKISSLQQIEITGSSNITVREWLSNQSFEEQQDFGIRIIKAFGGSL
jgi:hypothetical protein